MRPDVGSEAAGALRIRAEAALFDLDGVLVDSMPIIRSIFEDWARSCGLDPAHVVQTVHGRPTSQALADLVPAAEVAAHLAYLTAEEIRRSTEMVCLPGAKELLTGLRPGRWAVVMEYVDGASVVAPGAGDRRRRRTRQARPRLLPAGGHPARHRARGMCGGRGRAGRGPRCARGGNALHRRW